MAFDLAFPCMVCKHMRHAMFTGILEERRMLFRVAGDDCIIAHGSDRYEQKVWAAKFSDLSQHSAARKCGIFHSSHKNYGMYMNCGMALISPDVAPLREKQLRPFIAEDAWGRWCKSCCICQPSSLLLQSITVAYPALIVYFFHPNPWLFLRILLVSMMLRLRTFWKSDITVAYAASIAHCLDKFRSIWISTAPIWKEIGGNSNNIPYMYLHFH